MDILCLDGLIKTRADMNQRNNNLSTIFKVCSGLWASYVILMFFISFIVEFTIRNVLLFFVFLTPSVGLYFLSRWLSKPAVSGKIENIYHGFRKTVRNVLMVTVTIVSSLLILSGLGIFGSQILAWLKEGQWLEVPLATPIAFMRDMSSYEFIQFLEGHYLYSSDAWVGVGKIILMILKLPLSLVLIVTGWCGLYKGLGD